MNNICKIKNISGEIKTLHEKEFAIDEVFIITRDKCQGWRTNEDVISALENKEFEVYSNNDVALGLNTAKSLLSGKYISSAAVDNDGLDCVLNGTDWGILSAERVIWDINGDYDSENNQFNVPFDGIYFVDGQWKFTNISGVTAIEIAIFKKGDPDDYWFILDKKLIASGTTECQLATATTFDFYEVEAYDIRVKLYGDENATATLVGDDDYTAWGFSFFKEMHI